MQLFFKRSDKESETNCLFLSADLLFVKKWLCWVCTNESLYPFSITFEIVSGVYEIFPKVYIPLKFPFSKQKRNLTYLYFVWNGNCSLFFSIDIHFSIVQNLHKKDIFNWFDAIWSRVGRPPTDLLGSLEIVEDSIGFCLTRGLLTTDLAFFIALLSSSDSLTILSSFAELSVLYS